MNYLAHGLGSLEHPWELAGTALPDLVRVADRRQRVTEAEVERALTLTAGGNAARDARVPDPELCRALARGVLRHHLCDRAFHGSPTFRVLCQWTARVLRSEARGLERTHVLAHVLVEMLLDAALIEEAPDRLDRYYQSLGELRADAVHDHLRAMTRRHHPGLTESFRRFVRLRFLASYDTDAGLAKQLAQVMRRVQVGLREDALVPLLPRIRARVRDQREALLAPVHHHLHGELP